MASGWGIHDYAFQTDSAGRPTFWPWGSLGRGYLLNSEEQLQAVRRFSERRDNIAGIGILFGIAAGGAIGLVVVFALFCLWDYFTLPKVTLSLEKSDERFPYVRVVKSKSWTLLLVGLIGMIGIFVLGALVVHRDPNYSLGWIVVSTSPIFVALSCHQIYLKSRNP